MSRGPAWSGGLIVAGLLLAPAAVSEEIIRLKSGGMVRGTLTKQTATDVVVQTEMGTITLAPDAILSIEQEPDAEAPEQPREETWEVGEPSRPPAAFPEEAAAPSLVDASQAVALIVSFLEDGSPLALGSGVVITNRGLIITNYHVVYGAKRIKAVVPDSEGKISLARFPREYTARLLKVHECYDLALLRIPKETPQYLRFAEDQDITVGIPVNAIGNPQGLTTSVSKGIVSAIRALGEMGLTISGCEHLSGRTLEKFSLVQTDAAVNPGNSGGPLLNDRNEIVGINTIRIRLAEGLNFAVHARHAREFAGRYLKE